MFLLVRKSKKFWENVRKWSKICFFFLLRTSFYFSLFKCFFWIESKFIKFLAAYRAHFFDFLLYFAGKRNFLWMEWTKMDFFQICAFFFSELVFYFSLFKVFFWIESEFTKFLAAYRAHFFDFLPYFAGKFIFLCQI